MLTDNEYDRVLKIAVENAKHLIDQDESIKQDEDKFHRNLFDAVLTEVDNTGDLYRVDAADVSDICVEVEGDILHGDILGL